MLEIHGLQYNTMALALKEKEEVVDDFSNCDMHAYPVSMYPARRSQIRAAQGVEGSDGSRDLQRSTPRLERRTRRGPIPCRNAVQSHGNIFVLRKYHALILPGVLTIQPGVFLCLLLPCRLIAPALANELFSSPPHLRP